MATKEIFERFDKDKDGKLSLDEFREVALVISPNITQAEIVKVFKAIDVDGDGELNVDEFTSHLDKMLKDAFHFCDIDGDRKISGDEFYEGMKRLGLECNKERCVAIVQYMDADGDGYLSFEEFEAMVCNCVVPKD